MARIRTIKPEYWSDGDLLTISRDARLFYIGLWNFADDNGVLNYDLIGIKAKIFPADNIKIERLLAELSKIKKVLEYENNGKKYLFVKNLTNHQVIDRPRKSNLPLPEGCQLKSIEINIGGKEGREGREGSNQPIKLKFLEFVLLTEKEHLTLIEAWGELVVKEYIERLNNYIGAKGKDYRSHYHALCTWIKKDRPEVSKSTRRQL
jgi:hypothetical protein